MTTEPPANNDPVRAFVIAGHGDLATVQSMLAAQPSLLNVAYQWKETDHESAIMAAAHVGNVPIAEFLLSQGAPLAIYTAAMLGRQPVVEQMLASDPAAIHTNGAHGITLLTHATISGSVGLVSLLYDKGAQTGASSALHMAVRRGHADLVRWFLDNTAPDLTTQNFQGKTALAVATERNDEAIVKLLRAHGATA